MHIAFWPSLLLQKKERKEKKEVPYKIQRNDCLAFSSPWDQGINRLGE